MPNDCDSQQPAGLIDVLRDHRARLDERDDAAMDLAAFDTPEALAALVAVATDPNEDAMLLDSCGESVAEIWVRRGKIDEEVLDGMARPAQEVAVATLLGMAPHLLPSGRRGHS